MLQSQSISLCYRMCICYVQSLRCLVRSLHFHVHIKNFSHTLFLVWYVQVLTAFSATGAASGQPIRLSSHAIPYNLDRVVLCAT